MFYGWKLSGFSSLGNFLLQGGVMYTMNAFLEPLCSLHGWSRADISLIMSCAAISGALSAPLLSNLAARIGLRATMTLGALAGGLCIILLGWTNNLLIFGALYTLAWVSGQAFGGVVANLLINRWFERYQGRAFGVCAIGTSLSGAIMPFILLLLIDFFDVRTAWTAYGLVLLALAPVCWHLIRDTPEEMGMYRDDLPPLPKSTSQKTENIPLKTLLHTPALFWVGLTFGCMLMVGSAVMSQLKPRLVDVGFSSYAAMSMMCLAALCAALSKYFWGWLCDKINPMHVTRILVLSILCSLCLVFLPQTPLTACTFVVIFGMSVGGAWVVLPNAVVHVFGKHRFLSAYRIIAMFIILKGVGFPLLGFSYTYTGSYNLAYAAYSVMLGICFGITFLLNTEADSSMSKHPQPA